MYKGVSLLQLRFINWSFLAIQGAMVWVKVPRGVLKLYSRRPIHPIVYFV